MSLWIMVMGVGIDSFFLFLGPSNKNHSSLGFLGHLSFHL
jgi:hypothetical protein